MTTERVKRKLTAILSADVSEDTVYRRIFSLSLDIGEAFKQEYRPYWGVLAG